MPTHTIKFQVASIAATIMLITLGLSDSHLVRAVMLFVTLNMLYAGFFIVTSILSRNDSWSHEYPTKYIPWHVGGFLCGVYVLIIANL